jgi:hypothetical protein
MSASDVIAIVAGVAAIAWVNYYFFFSRTS